MRINYGKMISDFFKLKFDIKRTIKEARSNKNILQQKLLQLQQNAIFFEKNNPTKIKELQEKKKTIAELTSKLKELDKDYDSKITRLTSKFNSMRELLKGFSVDFKDVLLCIFPDYSPKTYSITCTTSYNLNSAVPLTKERIIQYFRTNPKEVECAYFTITVKNNRTNNQHVFYKLFNVDEPLSDGSALYEHTSAENTKCLKDNRYDNWLVFDNSKIPALKIYVKDFHYNAAFIDLCLPIAQKAASSANGGELIKN